MSWPAPSGASAWVTASFTATNNGDNDYLTCTIGDQNTPDQSNATISLLSGQTSVVSLQGTTIGEPGLSLGSAVVYCAAGKVTSNISVGIVRITAIVASSLTFLPICDDGNAPSCGDDISRRK